MLNPLSFASTNVLRRWLFAATRTERLSPSPRRRGTRPSLKDEGEVLRISFTVSLAPNAVGLAIGAVFCAFVLRSFCLDGFEATTARHATDRLSGHDGVDAAGLCLWRQRARPEACRYACA